MYTLTGLGARCGKIKTYHIAPPNIKYYLSRYTAPPARSNTIFTIVQLVKTLTDTDNNREGLPIQK